jgi:glyoxylase-like metal-dependent hydrolase (beta-lactamase superfamily II)/rhodanese-related sulfurtransferase
VILRQILHDDLGCASYLIGDEAVGVAAVVDPRLDIDVYVDLATYLGVRIVDVFETHNHADHVSGHGRLAAVLGATIHVHREARAGYPHEPFEDGERWRLGALTIRALHTPGHRPEHTAFVLATGDGEPWAVLSGDSLLVNEVARPDLAIDATQGAHQIFHSLHDRLLRLGGDVEVWPGHIGGSMCGGPDMDLRSASTIGFESRHSPLLAVEDEETFVERTLARLGPPPANAAAIVDANISPRRTPDFEPPALDPRQVEALRQAGALTVDVRDLGEFAAGHLAGATSLPATRPGFGTRLVSIVEPGRQMVLIGSDDEGARRAARLAAAVAVEQISAVLAGGFAAWSESGLPTAELEQVGVSELDRLIERLPGLQILDVREPAEWAAFHLPGSINRPWQELASFPAELDPDLPIATICGSGQRAAIAASRLAGLGAERVIHVRGGGVADWAALHRDRDAV